jgi:small subunit ribosomal protein S10
MKTKIRIKLESFNSQLLNIACTQILEKVKISNVKIIGPILLPTKKRVYCVLRSPHVNKDAREHFEIRIYKRMLDIYPETTAILKSFLNIKLPSGVTTSIQ